MVDRFKGEKSSFGGAPNKLGKRERGMVTRVKGFQRGVWLLGLKGFRNVNGGYPTGILRIRIAAN